MPRAARNKDTDTTDKEEVFCQAIAYDPTLNDSDAYRKAYNCKNMKPESINRAAQKVKVRPNIAARVAKLREERANRTQINADYVLKRLGEMDAMDVIDILNDDGSMKSVREWPKVWRISISGIDISELLAAGGDEKKTIAVIKKIKWPDKVKNLELIGKHIDVQAFKEKIDHSGEIAIHNLSEDEKRARVKQLLEKQHGTL